MHNKKLVKLHFMHLKRMHTFKQILALHFNVEKCNSGETRGYMYGLKVFEILFHL